MFAEGKEIQMRQAAHTRLELRAKWQRPYVSPTSYLPNLVGRGNQLPNLACGSMLAVSVVLDALVEVYLSPYSDGIPMYTKTPYNLLRDIDAFGEECLRAADDATK